MKASLTFSAAIPQPCPQSWNDMTASDGGRLCSSCEKKVIDFSILTDAEIVQIFGGSAQKICGRFNPSQLNRVLDKQETKRPYLPAVVLSALLVMNGSETTASPAPSNLAPLMMRAGINDGFIQPESDTQRIITGKLVDPSNRENLPGTIVSIKGSASATVTDAEGNFRLYIPDSLNRADITLVCAFVGYNTKEFRVTDNGPLTIELSPQTLMLTGDVVITCMRKDSFRERVKSRWKRLWGK